MGSRRSDPELPGAGEWTKLVALGSSSTLGSGSNLGSGDGAIIDGSAVVESGASDYAQLKAGQIDVEEYLSLTVDRAVAHLEGQLPAKKIEAMREILRSSLEHDPDLQALARRATQSH